VLVLMEAIGPETGKPADADPARRHAIRLRTCSVTTDPAGGLFDEQPSQDAVPVTEISWGVEDALPFPLCLSSRRGTSFYRDVSVALGNIVLVDHGLTVAKEDLPIVPRSDRTPARIPRRRSDRCAEPEVIQTPLRYRPALARSPLTYASAYRADDVEASAASVMRWDIESLMPAIWLNDEDVSGEPWRPVRDLLSSTDQDARFVVEVEDDGTACLRFGDDRFGKRPTRGSRLAATYRVGNGTRGNVGRESIAHLVSAQGGLEPLIERVWNPMAARMGTDPEPLEQVRQKAPAAFREQERAVTPEDYVARARDCRTDLQKAAATFRWTGSWRTVFVTADRLGGGAADPTFKRELRACLDRYRMAGHDLEIDDPIPVALEIDMQVCVQPDYFAEAVRTALLDLFSNRRLPDGRKGLFHQDNFSFGQSVYLSPLYAAAQAVAGVQSVKITKFQRRGLDSPSGIDEGRLDMGRLEIPRLDNDPNYRERGVFTLTLTGGR
jgi:hypothetical protein